MDSLHLQSGDEHRALTPGGDARRALYDKMLAINSEPCLDEILDLDVAKELADRFAGELLNLNPYVGLRYELESGKWDLTSSSLRVGAFNLIYPRLKTLNDACLGEAMADRYLEELSGIINECFNEDEFAVFAMKGKSGHFLVDLQKCAENWGVSLEAAVVEFASKLRQVQHKATKALARILNLKVNELVARLKANGEALSSHREATTVSLSKFVADTEDADRILTRLKANATLSNSLPPFDRDDLIEEEEFEEDPTLRAIETLPSDLDKDLEDIFTIKGELVHVGFGLARPLDMSRSDIDDEAWNLALLNSGRAARTTGLRTFDRRKPTDGEVGMDTDRSGGYERLLVHDFRYVYLIMDLLRARGEMEKAVDDVSIGSRWHGFFEKDEFGRLRMCEDMIIKYRKQSANLNFEGELANDEYRRGVFADYYERVNILDGFNEVDFERVIKITQLVRNLKSSVALEELKDFLKEAKDELDISMKDIGGKIIGAVRSEVKEVMDGEHNLTIIGDHVGFGGMNQRSYEETMLKLFDKLGVSTTSLVEEFGDQALAHGVLHRYVSRALTSVLSDDERRAEFVDVLKSVGSQGTQRIRGIDQKFYDYLMEIGASNVVIIPGGDEVRIIVTGKVDTTRLTGDLLDIARESKMRIFVAIDNTEKSDFPPKKIAQHMRVMAVAEETFRRDKEAGETGPTAHILTIDGSSNTKPIRLGQTSGWGSF